MTQLLIPALGPEPEAAPIYWLETLLGWARLTVEEPLTPDGWRLTLSSLVLTINRIDYGWSLTAVSIIEEPGVKVLGQELFRVQVQGSERTRDFAHGPTLKAQHLFNEIQLGLALQAQGWVEANPRLLEEARTQLRRRAFALRQEIGQGANVLQSQLVELDQIEQGLAQSSASLRESR